MMMWSIIRISIRIYIHYYTMILQVVFFTIVFISVIYVDLYISKHFIKEEENDYLNFIEIDHNDSIVLFVDTSTNHTIIINENKEIENKLEILNYPM